MSSFFFFFKTAGSQHIYKNYTPYAGNDLGVQYAPEKTIFKVWSPAASAIKLKIYKEGEGGAAQKELQFIKQKNYLWVATVHEDLRNRFYTYQATVNEKQLEEVPDIYAKGVGINGRRGMVVDLAKTNPPGWQTDKSPFTGSLNDAIIYELHVRDATIYSKAKNKGKFLGLTETGLTNSEGLPVGLDHIKKLGITHVQLLPVYDYYTVDESVKENPLYNWGYDPLNYNTPEGNYSTNPYDGNIRINEFKQLIQTFHQNKLAVIMDVVYNHTMFAAESYFNQLVPGYYYRMNKEGQFSNGTGCGNETASERAMFRKFILESVLYWVKEYHIDGFRFDLMAIHDLETMNKIATELRKIKPNIILLGEGWTAGASPLPDEKKAMKKNALLMPTIAVFGDDLRDAIKGSVFDPKDSGFISGNTKTGMSIRFGLVGAGKHPQIDYTQVNYSKKPFTAQPFQMIAYNECHDNHTLWDRLLNSNPQDGDDTRRKRYVLAMAIVLTAQGVPFIHAGQEFCRTKKGVENSYQSPDSINAIDWERLSEFKQEHELIQQLIRIRKTHPAFRLGNAALVQKHVRFENSPDGIIHMVIKKAPKDNWKEIHILFNATENLYASGLEPINYTNVFETVYSKDHGVTSVPALSCKIFIKEKF
jgi:pullulanase